MTKYLMILVCAPLLTACATTVGAESTIDQELAMLRQQNTELQRMAAMQRGTPARGGHAHAMMPPPARRRQAGPPQEWAWLHQRPQGCERGPLAVEFENRTFHHVALFLDGKRLNVRGADGVFPAIPPRTSVYVCLQETGTHRVAGIAYVSRYGELREVERFDRSNHFRSTLVGGRGTQWFPIDDKLLRFY